mgnify:CR=1 FL=1
MAAEPAVSDEAPTLPTEPEEPAPLLEIEPASEARRSRYRLGRAIRSSWRAPPDEEVAASPAEAGPESAEDGATEGEPDDGPPPSTASRRSSPSAYRQRGGCVHRG